jgi:pimeloyl-ACP methyl ester carboxylesterase
LKLTSAIPQQELQNDSDTDKQNEATKVSYFYTFPKIDDMALTASPVAASSTSTILRRTAVLATSSAMTEKVFTCTDGFPLAAQVYLSSSANTTSTRTKTSPSTSIRNENKKKNLKILMIHGWLDNCRSFWKLAPALSMSHTQTSHHDVEVVALDLPGHGLSGHRPKEAPSVVLSEAVYYVADVLRQLEWAPSAEMVTETETETNPPEVILIGHSVGAAISLAYAAAFPDHIHRLVLLEGVGPMTKPDQDVAKHLRRHVEARLKGNASMYGENAKGGPRQHASLDAAIEVRMKTALLAPGKQYLSQQAAEEMVTRATRTVDNGADVVQFVHDYRLTWPSLMYMTRTQVDSLEMAVAQCPTCLLLAQDGWPFEPERLAKVKERLNLKQFAILPGSHHFHADPDSADAVTEHIVQFIFDDDCLDT